MESPLSWIDAELAALETRHLRRHLQTHAGAQGARIEVENDRGTSRLINFGANDYLGLAADPQLAAAAARAMDTTGFGAGASPLITGHESAHETLERRLAEFEGTERAIVFSSGFAANLGTIAAVVERGDAIYADAKNHASLIDGCRLSRAEVHIYRHSDAANLSQLLRDTAASYRRRLIVTDALFSMDGDFAPLADIAELAKKHGAMLMVDEAHATGVFGATGRGVSEMLGVCAAVDIRMGTLSKALGCSGGFVAGSTALIEWLINRARTYVFSTAFPPALAAAAVAALDIIQKEPQRSARLLASSKRLGEELAEQGWNIGNCQSQIIPIHLGDEARTMQLAAALRERGFWVPGIRPPSVPVGESLLRISVSYAHTPEMIDSLLVALHDLRHSAIQPFARNAGSNQRD